MGPLVDVAVVRGQLGTCRHGPTHPQAPLEAPRMQGHDAQQCSSTLLLTCHTGHVHGTLQGTHPSSSQVAANSFAPSP